MSHSSAFVYSPGYLQYRFGEDHPFNPLRLEITMDLMSKLGILHESQIRVPLPASIEELKWAHHADFVDTVAAWSQNPAHWPEGAYGIGTEDTPLFPGMHEASSTIVGGTVAATKLVLSGEFEHALNMGGGLHHARRSEASGFCIYNDAAVAIEYAKRVYGARVLYIDTDAHHGDGVQWIFYDDPDVLTVSFHETGKYLYPGTGTVSERGDGRGYGYSVNIPLEAYTEDDSWTAALQNTLPHLVHSFRPDLIISQNGCDGHFLDPLTHLSASTRIYQQIPKIVHQLAHEVTQGRWVAVGGGGYDIWRVVPRAWTMLWAEMTDQLLPDTLPADWLQHWQSLSPVPLPTHFLDPLESIAPIPRRTAIEEKNAITVRQAMLGTPFVL